MVKVNPTLSEKLGRFVCGSLLIGASLLSVSALAAENETNKCFTISSNQLGNTPSGLAPSGVTPGQGSTVIRAGSGTAATPAPTPSP